MIYLVIANLVLLVVLIILVVTNTGKKQANTLKDALLTQFKDSESRTRDEFQRNREETARSDQSGRLEMNQTLRNALQDFAGSFDRSVQSFNNLQREKFAALESRQADLIQQTENKLEMIRGVVEEKLEKTLNERLKQSFATVSTQLTEVQKGLGEMSALADDVGGLKKVLSNVKLRGGFGEVQLSMLLDQLLSPEQFEANVKIKPGKSETVEFAIKLPGRSDDRAFVWLPIDAKFPKDYFEKLQEAYDHGDPAVIEASRKNFYNAIGKMAKDISEKYIEPPYSTDFAILFLPFESIFAEVVRSASFMEEVRRRYNVIITGPTTLGAILNSLQMGFKTLAIQKRSSEVWGVLGKVKKEFSNFGGLLGKAQANLQTGLNQLDEVLGRRTRAIERTLRNIEELPGSDRDSELPNTESSDAEEDE
ncbi:MAG: DNA recombination protein RmuC [Chitinophagaceae bacterium]|nr:DNA recombination protein RmuC [Chitinophagaceae bacterium]MCW5913420.1 DNA recombination protein RmuC [Chitinophagaceae bacterium]MCZ2395827.1 DNA recombination protein RmuC [Chitinophagales bacterium]